MLYHTLWLVLNLVTSKGPKHNVEIKLNCKPMEKSAAISEHLSTVEIKCEALDGSVSNILNFLGKTYGTGARLK
ncbi:unnamed protein product [Urochloa humidicola]